MNKTIKVSPVLARIINSFGKSRTSLPSANGTKIVIRNPELLRIIRAFGKASNQVKSSPLSLRSADNANYSEVQALKDRIAKLINEKEYLKGQYDQQKTQDKASYDSLLAQHNDLNMQYGDLEDQYGDLEDQYGNLEDQNGVFNYFINSLRDKKQRIIDLIKKLIEKINSGGINPNHASSIGHLNKIKDYINNI